MKSQWITSIWVMAFGMWEEALQNKTLIHITQLKYRYVKMKEWNFKWTTTTTTKKVSPEERQGRVFRLEEKSDKIKHFHSGNTIIILQIQHPTHSNKKRNHIDFNFQNWFKLSYDLSFLFPCFTSPHLFPRPLNIRNFKLSSFLVFYSRFVEIIISIII